MIFNQHKNREKFSNPNSDILETIGQMERFHPRIALRWHMGRVFLLYFGNLAILMWALFERINTDDDAINVDPCSKELTTGDFTYSYYYQMLTTIW